jgi:hypothetical protein
MFLFLGYTNVFECIGVYALFSGSFEANTTITRVFFFIMNDPYWYGFEF